MRTEFRAAAGLCLVLLACASMADDKVSSGGVPLDSPGLRGLPEGGGFEALGTPGRISGPDALALAALRSDAEIAYDDHPEQWISFTPRGTIRGGLVFYPGAECDVRAYAAPLREIARRGYFVVAVRMPRSLAMMGTNRALDVIETHPEIHGWAIAGHSMGGPAAAIFATQHPDSVTGLLLWDAYIMKPADLSKGQIPVMLIHRADANGAPPERFARQDGLVPADMARVPIIGASHMQFGNFIPAAHRNDPPATISVADQQAQIVAATLRFLATVVPGQD